MSGFSPSVMAAAVPGAAKPAALQANRPGNCSADSATPIVFIVLSPRMPYAIQEWPRIRRSAEMAGFRTVSLRDPRIGDREWRAAVRAAGVPAAIGLRRLQEPALLRQFGALNHFPIALVQSGSRTHPWPILGVMPDAAFVSVLGQRLRQLCAAAP